MKVESAKPTFDGLGLGVLGLRLDLSWHARGIEPRYRLTQPINAFELGSIIQIQCARKAPSLIGGQSDKGLCDMLLPNAFAGLQQHEVDEDALGASVQKGNALWRSYASVRSPNQDIEVLYVSDDPRQRGEMAPGARDPGELVGVGFPVSSVDVHYPEMAKALNRSPRQDVTGTGKVHARQATRALKHFGGVTSQPTVTARLHRRLPESR